MSKKGYFPNTTIELPYGLINHNKKEKREAGYFRLLVAEATETERARYTQTAEFIGLEPIDIIPQVELYISQLLNGGNKPKPKSKRAARALRQHAERFIKERKEARPDLMKPNGEPKPKFNSQAKALFAFVDSLDNVPLAQLSQRPIAEHWKQLTFWQQQTLKPIATEFINDLLQLEVTTQLTVNPYTILKFKVKPAKNRDIMTMADLQQIIDIARQTDQHFVANSLMLGFYTGLRRNDIVNLRFDNIVDNKLTTIVTKSEGGAQKTKRHTWDLAVHKELRLLINELRESALQHRNCPYLIHHDYQVKRKSENKNHSMQVLGNYLGNAIKDIKNTNRSSIADTCFHELRALYLESALCKAETIQDVSKDLGHSDVRTTERHYGTHRQYNDHNVTTVQSLR